MLQLAASIAALLLLGGCDAAPNATPALKDLNTIPLLSTPPTDGVELARAQDRGSGIVGREAGITVVYATPRTPGEIASYYQQTYPAYVLKFYGFNGTHLSGSTDLAGRRADIGITIQTGAPDLDPVYQLKLRAAPAGAATFVTVNVLAEMPPRPRPS